MSESFLQKIVRSTQDRVEIQKRAGTISQLRSEATEHRSQAEKHRFRAALSRGDRLNIITEIKRASPSKGIINEQIDVAEVAKNYVKGGACAISVLTEESYFLGSIDDLRLVRKTVEIPILRKDFIIDELQIYEAAAAGADAILLIVAVLDIARLSELRALAEVELGMDSLIEVHTLPEVQSAIEIGADIIGVNNRDLHSFEISLDVSRELILHRPPDALMVAESGISSASQITELSSLGFDAFLIGESLMRGQDPKTFTRAAK